MFLRLDLRDVSLLGFEQASRSNIFIRLRPYDYPRNRFEFCQKSILWKILFWLLDHFGLFTLDCSVLICSLLLLCSNLHCLISLLDKFWVLVRSDVRTDNGRTYFIEGKIEDKPCFCARIDFWFDMRDLFLGAGIAHSDSGFRSRDCVLLHSIGSNKTQYNVDAWINKYI